MTLMEYPILDIQDTKIVVFVPVVYGVKLTASLGFKFMVATCFMQPMSVAFGIDFNIRFDIEFEVGIGMRYGPGDVSAGVGARATLMDVLVEPRAWLYLAPLPPWPSFSLSISILPLKISFYAFFKLRVCAKRLRAESQGCIRTADNRRGIPPPLFHPRACRACKWRGRVNRAQHPDATCEGKNR